MTGDQRIQEKRISGRRAMIRIGTAILGTCLLSAAYRPAENSTKRNGPDPDPVFNVRQFGATGKRQDNSTKAFHDAVEACSLNGGGTVYVPPREYTVGTIQLMDNITLNISAGATLFLSQSRADFKHGSYSMIFADHASNITVTGGGVLDGLAQYDYLEMNGMDPEIAEETDIAKASGEDMRRYFRKKTAMNTYMFIMNDCINFKVSDISIIHSPLWNVLLNDCDRVFICGIYIYSDLEKGVNADGIDICSSANVTISDSVIVTGDDSIVVKSISRDGKKANPCENITVTNCILESSSTPLVIGTETEADIRHIVFCNCVIRNSNRGLGINVQDGATVSSVIFSNITIETKRRHWNWWGSAELFRFVLKKRHPESRLGRIRDIFISNVIAQVRGTSIMSGHPDHPLEDIRISGMRLFMNPEDAADKRATDALRMEGVRNLEIRDLAVNWATDMPEKKWQHALVLKNVSRFEIDFFSGRQGLEKGNDPAILLDNVKDGVIRNSRGDEGTQVFIHLQGNESEGITLRNNNTKKAGRYITYGDGELKKVVDLD